MANKFLLIFKLLPILILIISWQVASLNDTNFRFYFGSPEQIAKYLIEKTINGSLAEDFLTTLFEAAAGFVIGNTVGIFLGLSLWFSKTAFAVSRPYIIAMGSAPIFALAPILIIWFGTDTLSKILIAALSSVFIALHQAYSGAAEVKPEYIKLMKSMKASKMQIFKKVIAPSSVVWVTAAFRINIGFALLGAFIGEYISSNAGLGHMIVVASGLFNISLVLTGVLLLMVIAIGLNFLVGKLERPITNLIVKTL